MSSRQIISHAEIIEVGRANPGVIGIPGDSLFSSFFIGGFECSTHRNLAGRRLDLIAATGHDQHAKADYARLREVGIRTARDGLRWHLIERTPGCYDFSSALPLIKAARETGVQVIWDLFHYGWPDDLDIFGSQFSDRLAGVARAFAKLLVDETDETPFICPINEISFFSWAAGDEGFFFPYARNRGDELKRRLVQASIAAIDAIHDVCPDARIVHTDPLINVTARLDPQLAFAGTNIVAEVAIAAEAKAEEYRRAQYEAWDMLSGKLEPELGGHKKYLDIIGLNYYLHNQWFYPDRQMVPFGSPLYRPLNEMLSEVYQRYRRPIFIAETGVEDQMRPDWLRYVSHETRTALSANVPIEGICLYPIVNHPGWDDERHCHNGLWDYPNEAGNREPYEPLACELRQQMQLLRNDKALPAHQNFSGTLLANFRDVSKQFWSSN